MKYDVFISYSRKDFNEVNAFLMTLCEHIPNLTYWFDITGIESGDEFDDKIITAIDNSRCVLFMLSDNSLASNWSKDEVVYAKNTKKKVIPILLKCATLNDGWFLFKFGRIDCIDSTDSLQVEKLINNLSTWISEYKAINDTLQSSKVVGDAITAEEKSRIVIKSDIGKIFTPKAKRNYNISYIKLKNILNNRRRIIRTLFDKENFTTDKIVNIVKSIKFWFITITLLLACVLYPYKKYIYNVTTHKIISPAASGSILAHDGRALAYSEPVYDLYLDCTHIIDSENSNDKENILEKVCRKLDIDILDKQSKEDIISEKGDSLWMLESQELSKALSNLLCDKTPEEYARTFSQARKEKKHWLLICKNVEQPIYDSISKMPLLCRGSKGGLIIRKHYKRKHPYGDLALRVLGYSNAHRKIGIEGAFDSIIRGIEGVSIVKSTNILGTRFRQQKLEIESQDGVDIHTTLAIPIQKVVDHALRSNISKDSIIYVGAVTVMDVKTGAIKAMSNISRWFRSNETELLGEYYNLAIGYAFEPGTVLGCATLAAYINDTSCSDITYTLDSGEWQPQFAINKFRKLENAAHPDRFKFCHKLIFDAENAQMTILDGVCKSNPYILSGLALYHSGRLPLYIKFLEEISLTEHINFDIEGLRHPEIAQLGFTDDYNYFLGTLGCGYGIKMSQLHILTFYNMIANDGIKVNPYIVASPKTINSTNRNQKKILPPKYDETIDALKSLMRTAVAEGHCGITGKAKDEMAGVAGHGFQYLCEENNYIDAEGKRSWNSTFVGYFPVENPRYSIICTIVTKRTKNSYPGNELPAKIVSEIYDALH